MKKTMKRWIAAILSLVLILGGAGYFADEKMDTVEAVETEEVTAEYGTYVWEALAYESSDKAPICKTEGYFFAGYYEDDKTTPVKTPVVGNTYQAKFVPDDVLTVKAQTPKTVDTSGNTPADVRLITTVDSLNYQTVGFRLKTDKKDAEFPLTGVLKKITADNGAGAYNYSANIFDLASKYYATATFTNIKEHDKAFFVEPYWITLDGTKVTGIGRYMRISDSYADNPSVNGGEDGYVNIPVYLNNDDSVKIGAGTTITIDKKRYNIYGSGIEKDGNNLHLLRDYDAGTIFTKDEIKVEEDNANKQIIITIKEGVEAEVAKGLLVNLRLQLNFSYTNSLMASRYLFAMTASNTDIKVNDILQRNLLQCNNNDKSSYVLDSVAVITNIAELKGLSAYITGNGTLEGKTILLATDIDMNPDWLASDGTAASNIYAPPSAAKGNFSGTFDGQNHSIKGLCVTDTSTNPGGLFNVINAAGTVKNLVLDNCRVARQSGIKAGTMAGVIYGTVENVEIKNSVISTPGKATVGALCSDLQGLAKNVTVTNCNVTGVGTYTGGITGSLDGQGSIQDVLIQDSKVTDNTFWAAGIVPFTNHTTPSINGAVVKNCTITSNNRAAGIMVAPLFPITNVKVIGGTITGGSTGAGGVVLNTSNKVENAIVQDVKIESAGRTGGIAALLYEGGSISKAYCDATLTNTGTSQPTGGIVAAVQQSKAVGSASIADCWYAGVLNANKDMGGIVGVVKQIDTTISHCHNTGKVVSTLESGNQNVGGIVGIVDSEIATVHTVTIEDCLNFSKLEKKDGSAKTFMCGIVGQYYSNADRHIFNVNKTYSINHFGPSTDAAVESGWPRTFNANKNLYLDGTAYKGQSYYNTEDEWMMALGQTVSAICPTSNGKLCLTLDTSFGAADENCWWIIKDGVPRLKTFKDMEFKRGDQLAQ